MLVEVSGAPRDIVEELLAHEIYSLLRLQLNDLVVELHHQFDILVVHARCECPRKLPELFNSRVLA